jgi:hypothetical protein
MRVNLATPRIGRHNHFRQGVGGGVAQDLRKTQILPQKVADGKKITINYSCALNKINQWQQSSVLNLHNNAYSFAIILQMNNSVATELHKNKARL